MTLLDTAELDDRDTARGALGLPLDRRLALVALGAGNINDTSQRDRSRGGGIAAAGCRDLRDADARSLNRRSDSVQRACGPRIPALPPVPRV